VLDAFDAADIVTARGGLQKLARAWLSQPLMASGLSHSWSSSGLLGPDTPVFKTDFKVTVGLLMALAYALLFEPMLRGSFLRKGVIAAVPFWLLNACVVLPLLGEGVAGVCTLTVGGLLSYALRIPCSSSCSRGHTASSKAGSLPDARLLVLDAPASPMASADSRGKPPPPASCGRGKGDRAAEQEAGHQAADGA